MPKEQPLSKSSPNAPRSYHWYRLSWRRGEHPSAWLSDDAFPAVRFFGSQTGGCTSEAALTACPSRTPQSRRPAWPQDNGTDSGPEGSADNGRPLLSLSSVTPRTVLLGGSCVLRGIYSLESYCTEQGSYGIVMDWGVEVKLYIY